MFGGYTVRLRYHSCGISGKLVALTFDDGPLPGTTDVMLDILKSRSVKATFFVVGKNVAAHPDLMRRIASEGHEIGNHSWDHVSFRNLDRREIARQISSTDQAVQACAGTRPTVFRPPFGINDAAHDDWIRETHGHKTILWSVDPEDWKIHDPSLIAETIVTNARPGSIILAHDVYPASVEAMPLALDGLSRKGFQFLGVSELILKEQEEARPGHDQ